MSDLLNQQCKPCEGGVPPLTPTEVEALMAQVPAWQPLDHSAIQRTFKFKNYYETMAFVSAVAWIAHQQDHHPELEVHYSRCVVRYSTHAVGGLSQNDFICAARVDALLRPPEAQ